MTVDADAPVRKMQFYRTDDAWAMDENPIMSPPWVDPAVRADLDPSPLAAGQKVTVLFAGDRPDGFSLVQAWFGCGYKLPRHSHNADCLDYVLTGGLTIGTRVLGPGEGFDMQITDQTAAKWKPLVGAALSNREAWLAEAATK